MRKLWQHAIPALTLLVIGCSGLEVSQDYDVNTDFSGLKLYAWKSEKQAQTGDIRVDNPLLDARIRAAVDRALTAGGLHKAPEKPPAENFLNNFADPRPNDEKGNGPCPPFGPVYAPVQRCKDVL